jgi:hypothetical protein
METIFTPLPRCVSFHAAQGIRSPIDKAAGLVIAAFRHGHKTET